MLESLVESIRFLQFWKIISSRRVGENHPRITCPTIVAHIVWTYCCSKGLLNERLKRGILCTLLWRNAWSTKEFGTSSTRISYITWRARNWRSRICSKLIGLIHLRRYYCSKATMNHMVWIEALNFWMCRKSLEYHSKLPGGFLRSGAVQISLWDAQDIISNLP